MKVKLLSLSLLILALSAFDARSAVLVPFGSGGWKYFVGTQEATTPVEAWRTNTFNDSSWTPGTAPFGYPTTGASGLEATIFTVVPTGTLSVFCRQRFVVANPTNQTQINLTLHYDDGVVAWINGVEVGRFSVAAGAVAWNTPGIDHEVTVSDGVVTLTTGLTSLLVPGTNILALQVLNSSSGSSDLFVDGQLESTVDDQAPIVQSMLPPQGATVTTLNFIDLLFSEPITGINASDLVINGIAATSITTNTPLNYVFGFAPPATGVVTVAWAPGHGITDQAAVPNAFAGGSWTYTFDPNAAAGTAIISEFLADNAHGLEDEDGSRGDWVELYNTTTIDVNLNGWFLTDTSSNLTKWRFPAVNLGPNKYLLVWASEKDRTNPAAPLHTNFKLPREGGYLALVNASTNVVSAFAPYPAQVADNSYGRDRVDPNLVGYFILPTPGAQNSTNGPGFAAEPVFSLNSGIYTNDSLNLTITSAPGTTIRYTITGAEPTSTSTLYSGPIVVSGALMIKARVFQTGLWPSAVGARSFIMLDSSTRTFSSDIPIVIISTPAAIPTSVAPGGARQRGTVAVIDTFRGRAALAGQTDFLGLGQFETFGQTSEGFPKKPHNIEINDNIGNDMKASLLGMPAEADWKLRNPYSDKCMMNDFLAYELFDKMGNYSVRRRLVEVFVDTGGAKLTYPGDYYGILVLLEKIEVGKSRVDIAELTPSHTNEPSISGGYMIKYDKNSTGDINLTTPGGGGFQGLTPEAGRALKLHEPKPREITSNQMWYLTNFLAQMEKAMYAVNWTTATGTNHYTNYLDPDAFADTHWINEFPKQIDGYRLSNYMRKDRNGRLKMAPVWDWNLSFGNANYLDGGNATGWYYTQLAEKDHPWLRRLICGTVTGTTTNGDPYFLQKIADRWSVLRTNVMNGSNVVARIDQIAAQLNESAPRDFAKFPRLYPAISPGQTVPGYVWPNPNGSAGGWSVDYVSPTTYAGIIAQMKLWTSNRYVWIDNQFARPPVHSHPGGSISPGLSLSLAAEAGASILYTLDGTDPRTPLGGVAAGAATYSGPITINANARVVSRARKSGTWAGTWSGPSAATYIVQTPQFIISEIMYHPLPPTPGPGVTNIDEDFEYIEFRNTGATTLNVNGYHLGGGVDFTFPSLLVTSGQRVVVVKNQAVFTARYGGGFTIAGQYTGSLGNSGNHLVLEGGLHEPILDFSYSDNWYRITDGYGFSLVIVNENAPLNTWGLAASWRPSGTLNGTPGQAEGSAPSFPQVVINEALTHSDTNLVPGQMDAIELRNLAGTDAAIGGWFLTDDLNTPKKYRISNGTLIAAGGFLTFTENDFNVTNAAGNVPFALSSLGDEVYLFSGDANTNLTGYVQGFDFGPQFSGRTFGRYTTSLGEDHFVAQSISTLGTGNSAPLVLPVVISEIHYHPIDVVNPYGAFDNTEDEYIELHNISGGTVSLYDPSNPTNRWRLRDAVDFAFPATNLPAGGYALVVSFDPANAAALATFRANNNVPVGVPVFGPFSGKLDNSGDSVELVRPDAPTNGIVPYVLADKVHYSHDLPWPAGADGIGPSLQRIVETDYGNDPSNWVAGGRSPGASYAPGPSPGIVLQPQSQSVLGTTTAILSLVATGAPPLSFQWRFRPTGGSSFVPLPGAVSSILQRPNFAPDQAGDYNCVVLNPVGATVSTVATLSYITPANITQQPTNTEIRVRPDPSPDAIPGTNAVFILVATSINPPLSYQWRMNGTNLISSTHYSNVTSSTLIISNVTIEDFGDYACAVTDQAGTVYSSSATLYPLVRPSILIHPATQTVPAYWPVPASVVLSNGFPPPFRYTWVRASAAFATNISDSTTNFMIIPGYVVSNLSGAYTVRLTNRAMVTALQSNSASFNLTVVADTDGDGMPDSYELAYSGSTTDFAPGLDADGDGMSNLAEYLAGTDPSDPNSYLRIDQTIMPGVAAVNFGAISNKTYTVQFTDVIPTANWQKLADIVSRQNNRTEMLVDPAWSPRRYYRVVTPQQP